MKKALFLSLILATSASANVDHYTLKGEFWYSTVPTAIAVGDRYTVTFDLNLAVTDVDPALGSATFPNAITHLTFSPDPGSVGNYAGGNVGTPLDALLQDDFAGLDSFGFWAAVGFTPGEFNFPPAEGYPLASIVFNLNTTLLDKVVLTSPLGQTLGSALSGMDQIPLVNGENFHLEFGDFSSPRWGFSTITSVKIAPAPDASSWMTTAVAGAVVALMLGCARRRRRREVRVR